MALKKTSNTRGIAFVKFKSYDNEFEHRISVHILPKLTTSIPSVIINKPNWPHLQNLKLADPNFAVPGAIDVILGADVFSHIIEDGVIKGKKNAPIAQLTKLGWIVSGPSGAAPISSGKQIYHVSLDRELHDLLHRFWELEEVPVQRNSSISTADQECENHFKSTHTRDVNGRYIVRLPFKNRNVELGHSKTKAVRIIKNLSKKLASDPQYAQAYSDFIDEYEKLQHMRRIPDSYNLKKIITFHITESFESIAQPPNSEWYSTDLAARLTEYHLMIYYILEKNYKLIYLMC